VCLHIGHHLVKVVPLKLTSLEGLLKMATVCRLLNHSCILRDIFDLAVTHARTCERNGGRRQVIGFSIIGCHNSLDCTRDMSLHL
jgi:hypothetical protein